MKILILTYGSRGDVQPYIALGKGLKAAGHHVVLVTSERFREFVQENGLTYGYMNDDLLAILDSDQGKDLLENTTHIFQVLKQGLKLAKNVGRMQRDLLCESWEIAQHVKPDLVLFHPKALAGPHIAERLGIPAVLANPVPMFVPTSERPVIGIPDLKLGGWYNRFSYRVIRALFGQFSGKYVKEFRSDIGLAPRFSLFKTGHGDDIPVLDAYSEAILPRPSDWPDRVCITGYWFLERQHDWVPSPKLEAFLKAGPPPVYIGFGSMAGRNPERLARTTVKALESAGLRGILARGWGGLKPSKLPDTILQIDQAPHDWLFPQMAAIVHHGGAGTTAAALRAGKPSIVVPFFGDQFFWAKNAYKMGVSPKPIPQKKLAVESFSAALHAVTSQTDMIDTAAKTGAKIRREDGVANAVSFIEERLLANEPMVSLKKEKIGGA
ncbi:glycosyltransferase [Flexibacterium corallicola]|uniref:glycosyltransferase n=1 Tax=Flexibacterium corallicola TaxID=3037259 RepID=UPI00286F3C78|nr:glycosyltransferase [Pseudovibrio sp. M1P-2-3]